MTITFLPRITVDLTADQWELYSIPGRDDAARTLNQAASTILTQAWEMMAGTHPASILDAHKFAIAQWEQVADSLNGVGASDTEPRCVFRGLSKDFLIESPAQAIDRIRRSRF
ncbi:hypothetical protein SAMN05216466_10649 [Paraburkholderia phenazinium]|uniref:Uncharacterized protein n=1 Tax=Paraburkholderia phenazinium TaxID=60549 RepID=A0A1G7Y635_9BURK|nr:hypothetical protein [Paraburkholderia phenazinium]SDG91827.1 hypothetical protein SAMN05216466_10649 [Paraburkholderia phenazinium]